MPVNPASTEIAGRRCLARVCAENGIDAVTDVCPFMVLDGAGVPHAVHGWMRRTFGREVVASAPPAAPRR